MAHALAGFLDEEVCLAKTILWKACGVNIGELPNRQGKNKTRADIDDIVKALRSLKSTGKSPMILATGKMLKMAPISDGTPLTASTGDIAQRVSLLESSLKNFMTQQSVQIKSLTEAFNASKSETSSVKPAAFRNIASSTGTTDSPNKRKRVDDSNSPGTATHSSVDSGLIGNISKATVLKPSYAQYAANGPKTPRGVPGINRVNSGTEVNARRPSIMYGTAKLGKDDNEELLAADVALVASGVSKDASPEQLSDFLKAKGIGVIAIEKLTRDDAETRTNTFKIVIKLNDYEKAMMPDVWPYRVGVRHFKPKKNQGPSWQQQSSQSGGQMLGDRRASAESTEAKQSAIYSGSEKQISSFN